MSVYDCIVTEQLVLVITYYSPGCVLLLIRLLWMLDLQVVGRVLKGCAHQLVSWCKYAPARWTSIEGNIDCTSEGIAW